VALSETVSPGDPALEVRDLEVEVDGRRALAGLTLVVRPGEGHAVVGPDAAGRRALALALAGHPGARVTRGDVRLDGESLLGRKPHERARAGLLLAFAEPAAIPGVTVSSLLRQAVNAVRGEPVSVFQLQQEVKGAMEALGVDPALAKRTLDEGGLAPADRRRLEALQLALLKPRYAVLDLGADADAWRAAAKAARELGRKDAGLLALAPDEAAASPLGPRFVHFLEDGRISRTVERRNPSKEVAA